MDPSLDNKGYVVSHVTPRQALERKVESVFDDRYTFSMAGGESESERRECPHALLVLLVPVLVLLLLLILLSLVLLPVLPALCPLHPMADEILCPLSGFDQFGVAKTEKKTKAAAPETRRAIQQIREKITAVTEGGPGGLRRSFRVFDRNGDGQISVDEFDRVCRKYLNLRYDKALVKQVMEQFDDTGDGVIDFRKVRRPAANSLSSIRTRRLLWF